MPNRKVNRSRKVNNTRKVNRTRKVVRTNKKVNRNRKLSGRSKKMVGGKPPKVIGRGPQSRTPVIGYFTKKTGSQSTQPQNWIRRGVIKRNNNYTPANMKQIKRLLREDSNPNSGRQRQAATPGRNPITLNTRRNVGALYNASRALPGSRVNSRTFKEKAGFISV